MTDVLEKIGTIYALWDCRNRNCNNCVAQEMCRKMDSTEKMIFLRRISEEVRALIKERKEAADEIAEAKKQLTIQNY